MRDLRLTAARPPTCGRSGTPAGGRAGRRRRKAPVAGSPSDRGGRPKNCGVACHGAFPREVGIRTREVGARTSVQIPTPVMRCTQPDIQLRVARSAALGEGRLARSAPPARWIERRTRRGCPRGQRLPVPSRDSTEDTEDREASTSIQPASCRAGGTEAAWIVRCGRRRRCAAGDAPWSVLQSQPGERPVRPVPPLLRTRRRRQPGVPGGARRGIRAVSGAGARDGRIGVLHARRRGSAADDAVVDRASVAGPRRHPHDRRRPLVGGRAPCVLLLRASGRAVRGRVARRSLTAREGSVQPSSVMVEAEAGNAACGHSCFCHARLS